MIEHSQKTKSACAFVPYLSHGTVANLKKWLRGGDLNPRPLGYEPNELPDCSTPRHFIELGTWNPELGTESPEKAPNSPQDLPM